MPLSQYCVKVEIAGAWCWASSRIGCKLTEHLHELVYDDGNFVFEHDENHEADIDDVKGTDQVLGDCIAQIPFLKCNAGRKCLGRWRGIKRDVKARELR
jgi:hypothetical protein